MGIFATVIPTWKWIMVLTPGVISMALLLIGIGLTIWSDNKVNRRFAAGMVCLTAAIGMFIRFMCITKMGV